MCGMYLWLKCETVVYNYSVYDYVCVINVAFIVLIIMF